MKKIIYYTLILITFNVMLSQNNNSNSIGFRMAQTPIYFVNNEEVSELVIKKINPNNIDKVNILKGEKAKNIYGERAMGGVMLLETKNLSKSEVKKLQALYAINFNSNAKNKKLIISGLVIDCENVPIANYEITNLNTNEKIINTNDGKFILKCNKNDVISFKSKDTNEERILIESNKSDIIIKLSKKEKTNSSEKIIYKKPVIYLYPEKETDVSLKFNFNGKVLTTFPKYENSWEIKSYPDGKIFDKKTKRFYNSLFWDGERNFDQNGLEYKEGFIVERKELTSFLIEKLETIGLNNTETNDFVQYWLPILEQNEFNFIHFKTNEEYDKISENIVHPKPETSIRIMMEFHKISNPHPVIEQKLPKTKRKGFTIVEWGGAEIPENLLKKNL